MIVKQGRFYLKHNTLSEDAPIAIIFKVKELIISMTPQSDTKPPVGGAAKQLDELFLLIEANTWVCFKINFIRWNYFLWSALFYFRLLNNLH